MLNLNHGPHLMLHLRIHGIHLKIDSGLTLHTTILSAYKAWKKNTDIILDLLKAATIKGNGNLKFPWLSMEEMYETIDQIQAGPAPFCSHHFQYNGPMPPTPPK
jgi:hypothetical protein